MWSCECGGPEMCVVCTAGVSFGFDGWSVTGTWLCGGDVTVMTVVDVTSAVSVVVTFPG